MIDLHSLTANELESSQYYLWWRILQNLISAKLVFNQSKTMKQVGDLVASALKEYEESLSITLEESDVGT